jgi:hypothetical protein
LQQRTDSTDETREEDCLAKRGEKAELRVFEEKEEKKSGVKRTDNEEEVGMRAGHQDS